MDKINVTRSLLPERSVFDGYVDQIFKSGWLTNNGSLVRMLEDRLKEYLGVSHLVLVSNGTLALQLAYRLLDLQGEVITTPFTFVATASSLAWDRLNPVFSDIDPESLNLDVSGIENHITSRTSALVPVHVFGNPCRVEDLQKIADRHGLRIIYDASHAFGVRYKGRSLLTYGDISTLSFHATKLFHTIEGGALILKDEQLCEHARKMINFGITGPESIECLGINAKMNEFQAAMGLSLLDKIDESIRMRKRVSDRYDGHLSGKIGFQQHPEECSRNYGYYPVICPDESTLEGIQAKLNAAGIFPRRYFYPSLCELDFLSRQQDTPVSKQISRRILCLPLYPGLTDEHCDIISEIVLSQLREGV